MSNSEEAKRPIHRVNVDGKVRLVRAYNSAQARAFVARETITAARATQEDLVEYLGKVPVEDAGAEPAGDDNV